ncbi:MAG: hypothetical protein U9Q74_00770 [Gemmatimonadota bacterium]|nr:hypothetical protein [Gemmatimonadota bacterium]
MTRLRSTDVVGAGVGLEVAPGAAMDRAEVLSVSESLRVPAATYRQCVG